MKTRLSKKQKATTIYFNEVDSMIEVCTYNTALKHRLTKYAGEYPSECRPIDDDEHGCLTFEIKKGRFSFKLTAPYSEKRRKLASDLAKKNVAMPPVKNFVGGTSHISTCVFKKVLSLLLLNFA